MTVVHCSGLRFSGELLLSLIRTPFHTLVLKFIDMLESRVLAATFVRVCKSQDWLELRSITITLVVDTRCVRERLRE